MSSSECHQPACLRADAAHATHQPGMSPRGSRSLDICPFEWREEKIPSKVSGSLITMRGLRLTCPQHSGTLTCLQSLVRVVVAPSPCQRRCFKHCAWGWMAHSQTRRASRTGRVHRGAHCAAPRVCGRAALSQASTTRPVQRIHKQSRHKTTLA